MRRNRRSERDRRRVAANWMEQARRELEEELDCEIKKVKQMRDFGVQYANMESRGRASNGESEWMVFKSFKDAEKYALAYVESMIEDEPGMFTPKWLQNYIMVRPGDIKIIADEEADSVIGDMDDEDTLEQAGMLDEWEEIEERIDELNQELDDADFKEQKAIREKIVRLEAAQEELVQSAGEQLYNEHVEYTTDRLKNELFDYLDDLGYDLSSGFPDWVTVDAAKAAKDAIRMDGVAHFLDGYDGDAVELDSGAEAFGTN